MSVFVLWSRPFPPLRRHVAWPLWGVLVVVHTVCIALHKGYPAGRPVGTQLVARIVTMLGGPLYGGE